VLLGLGLGPPPERRLEQVLVLLLPFRQFCHFTFYL